MEAPSEISKLQRKLRKDLRNRFIVWPILMVFFGGMAFLTTVRLQGNMEFIAGLELAPDASPEWIRWSSIQASLPITLSLLLLMVNLLAVGYCLIQLIRPRTEAKLLLAMINEYGTSSQPAEKCEVNKHSSD